MALSIFLAAPGLGLRDFTLQHLGLALSLHLAASSGLGFEQHLGLALSLYLAASLGMALSLYLVASGLVLSLYLAASSGLGFESLPCSIWAWL